MRESPMAWDNFKRITFRKKKDTPGGLWMKCDGCGAMAYKKRVEEKLHVCPECNYHFPISSKNRIRFLLDAGSFEELFTDMAPCDPLKFKGNKPYAERLIKAQKQTGLKDAAIVGRAHIKGREIAFGVTDSRFLMGSMGSVVGEKISRLAEYALAENLPLIIVSGSGGGARMDEGMISLMQMAKTSAAIGRLRNAGGLFISVMTNPTMGGAAASFASLGDVILAEPKSLIGFAGPRVYQSTVRGGQLPEGFQRSEYLLEHGFVDMIVSRIEMRDVLFRLMEYCCNGSPYARMTVRTRELQREHVGL
ncbi:MAG: acetyl-CoA carboxylase, carboxyltransferase subunit beta [Planctomycetota bacterium]